MKHGIIDILVFGDRLSGKTSFIQKYTQKNFHIQKQKMKHSQAEYLKKTIRWPYEYNTNAILRFQLQQGPNYFLTSQFRKAHIALYILDLTKELDEEKL